MSKHRAVLTLGNLRLGGSAQRVVEREARKEIVYVNVVMEKRFPMIFALAPNLLLHKLAQIHRVAAMSGRHRRGDHARQHAGLELRQGRQIASVVMERRLLTTCVLAISPKNLWRAPILLHVAMNGTPRIGDLARQLVETERRPGLQHASVAMERRFLTIYVQLNQLVHRLVMMCQRVPRHGAMVLGDLVLPHVEMGQKPVQPLV